MLEKRLNLTKQFKRTVGMQDRERQAIIRFGQSTVSIANANRIPKSLVQNCLVLDLCPGAIVLGIFGGK